MGISQSLERIGSRFKGQLSSAQYEAVRAVVGSVGLPATAEEIRISLLSHARRAKLTEEDCAYAYEISGVIYGCVRWISDALNMTTFRTYRTRLGQFPERDENNPVIKMYRFGNSNMDEYELWDFTATGILLQGTVHHIFDVDEEAPGGIGVFPISTMYMRPQFSPKGLVGWWLVYPRIDPIPIPKERVLTCKFPSLSDLAKGQAPLNSIAVPLETDLAAQNYNRNFFKSGGRTEAVIEQDQTKGELFNETQLEAWVQKVQDRYAKGKDNKVLVLEPGMLWKSTGISMQDAQYIMQRKLSKEDICGIYKLHPILLANETGPDVEKAETLAWHNAVLPLGERLSSKVTHQLLLKGPMARRNVVAGFDSTGVAALSRDDLARMRVDIAAINSGRSTINERRLQANESSVEWGDQPPPSWYGSSKADATSPSMNMPGSEGGRDQSDDGEAQLADETGQR